MTTHPHLPNGFQKPPRRIVVTKQLLREGPLIINEPDTYVTFSQSVEVNFQEVFPMESPFHHGHFAAIIVGASRVVIDLKGYTLSMSPHMRQRNRFMSLIDLDVTPLPKGKIGFTQDFVSPSDITVRNGILGEVSHFGIHTAKAGKRILIERLTIQDYEVGAISMSGPDDLTIRHCKISKPIRPKTSSDASMFLDLMRGCKEKNMDQYAQQFSILANGKNVRPPFHTDSLCRCIVIANRFNVGLPPLNSSEPRIKRIVVEDVVFDDINSEPKEVVGISTHKGGEPIKDFAGNMISFRDAQAGNFISKMQASLTPQMNASVRQRLMKGPDSSFKPVYGLDRRAHALQLKGNLFCRIDAADDVVLRNVRGGRVRSEGKSSAAVGFMLNACTNVVCQDISIQGVYVKDPCVNALSNERPQSGLLLRQCKNVYLKGVNYKDESACACTIRETDHATMVGCNMNAPFTVFKAKHLNFRS